MLGQVVHELLQSLDRCMALVQESRELGKPVDRRADNLICELCDATLAGLIVALCDSETDRKLLNKDIEQLISRVDAIRGARDAQR